MVHFTAVGVFQGDADWEVEVQVHGFPTYLQAKKYANAFRIALTKDGVLLRDNLNVVPARDIQLRRIKPDVRERINAAHRRYAEQGMSTTDAAIDSLAQFENDGHHPLVLSESDYEDVDLPVAQWCNEPGLNKGFGSLSYQVTMTPVGQVVFPVVV